jgi:hypothetical protein
MKEGGMLFDQQSTTQLLRPLSKKIVTTMSVEGDKCMSDVSEDKLLIELLDNSCRYKHDEMQMDSLEEKPFFETPDEGIPREIYTSENHEMNMSPVKEEYSQWQRDYPLHDYPFIVDLTNSDDDREEFSIKNSDGVTFAVVVDSKRATIAAEKLCAFMSTLPRVKTHEVNDEDVKEYFPIMEASGKITGMMYSSRYGKVISRNGFACMRRFVWVDFMERLNSKEDHYRVVDNHGFMIGIKSIPKFDANNGVALSVKKQKKICDYFEFKKQN